MQIGSLLRNKRHERNARCVPLVASLLWDDLTTDGTFFMLGSLAELPSEES
jgi:hypothetical protein